MRSQRKERVHPGHPQQDPVGAMLGSLVLTTLVLEVPFIANMFGFPHQPVRSTWGGLALAVLVIPVIGAGQSGSSAAAIADQRHKQNNANNKA